ncbi:MAG: serine protease Do [Verrucomicrobiota bacterium]
MTLEVENNQGERFIGSAVLAMGDDVALTAWHVVWDAKSVWATFADGTRVKVIGCIDKDGDRDLAALKLERKFPRLKAGVSRDLQSVASRVYVIGAPKGYDFSISDGLISQVRRVDGFPQYQVSCPISSGNSGGPVLNDRGDVIGIVSWTKSDAQNVSFAVPTRELDRIDLTRAVVPWQQQTASDRPTLARRSVGSRLTSVPTSDSDLQILADLRKALAAAVGKNVTITLKEGRAENKFSFTMPARGLK